MDYDVTIIGGSLAGSSTAILLLKENPKLRVLVVESSPGFTRRVGEATVEVGAYFLGRVLGLTDFLNHTQLLKQGLRFWYANEKTASLDEASELGPRYLPRLPSYQIDRSVLDEEVLRRAGGAGAEIRRPARVTGVALASGGPQIVTVVDGDNTETIRSRWVVDASGVASLLPRQEGWWQTNTAHPTAAAWGRWTGVKPWDSSELADQHPDWAAAAYGIRGTATNHVVGDGWWSWWIPLQGGDVSIGIVLDTRLVEWPREGGSIGDRMKTFLMQHPVARELLADAQWIEKDVHWRRHLSYTSTTCAGDGFVVVGDAAAFMDPLYSPGIDGIAFTTVGAVEVITGHRTRRPLGDRVERYNRLVPQSYQRWFEALYQDKYHYLAEYDLMKIAFLLDLGLYYVGVVAKPFKLGRDAFLTPPFTDRASRSAYHLMRFYNRRFARIASHRRQLKQLGRMNHGHQCLIKSYTLARSEILRLILPLLQWGLLEIKEGWRSWGKDVESNPELAIASERDRVTMQNEEKLTRSRAAASSAHDNLTGEATVAEKF